MQVPIQYVQRIAALRTALMPEGPSNAPVQIIQTLKSGNGNGWVYDGLAHPEFSEGDDSIIYVSHTRDTGAGVREMRLLKVGLTITDTAAEYR